MNTNDSKWAVCLGRATEMVALLPVEWQQKRWDPSMQQHIAVGKVPEDERLALATEVVRIAQFYYDTWVE